MCGKRSKNSLRKLGFGLLLLLVLVQPLASLEVSEKDMQQISQNLRDLETKLANLQMNYADLKSDNLSLQMQVENWKTLYEDSQTSLTTLKSNLEKMSESSMILSNSLEKQADSLERLELSLKSTQSQLTWSRIGNYGLLAALGIVGGILIVNLVRK